MKMDVGGRIAGVEAKDCEAGIKIRFLGKLENLV